MAQGRKDRMNINKYEICEPIKIRFLTVEIQEQTFLF